MAVKQALFVPPQTSTSPTSLLADYYQHLELIENLSPKTIDNRRYSLDPLFVALQVESVQEVSLLSIDSYCAKRRATVKASSINSERQAYRSFFSYCQVYRLIELQFDYRSIKRSKEHPPRIEPLTKKQIATVVSKCENAQDRLMIALLFESGMRIGELLTLRLEHIHGAQIQVRGKGAKDRIVCIPEDLSRAIYDYCTYRGYTQGHVFRPLQAHSNHASDRYTSDYGVRDRIKREFAKHGIKMHPHLLRHSFAFNWLDNGGDLRSLQLLMGHSSIEITQRYLGLSDDYLCKVYKNVSPKSILGLT